MSGRRSKAERRLERALKWKALRGEEGQADTQEGALSDAQANPDTSEAGAPQIGADPFGAELSASGGSPIREDPLEGYKKVEASPSGEAETTGGTAKLEALNESDRGDASSPIVRQEDPTTHSGGAKQEDPLEDSHRATDPRACPYCGASLAADDWFCTSCGRVVAPHAQSASTMPELDQDSVKSLEERLSAHSAYIPEPTHDGHPVLLALGAVTVAAGLVFALGKAGVVKLPSPSAQTGSMAQAGSSASGSIVPGENSDPDGSGVAEGSGKTQDSSSSQTSDSDIEVEVEDSSVSLDGLTYTLVHESMTWTEARQYCEEHGGQLAQPHTKEEWRAVRDLCDESDAYVIYLGATRLADGTFAWLDGTEVELKTWGSGEPNNEGGDENYLAYLRYTGGGAIYDIPDDPEPFYPDGYVGFVLQTQQ